MARSGARRLEGGPVAATIVDGARERASSFARRWGRRPCLVAVLVGDDPGSSTYVGMKQRRCATAAIDSRLVHLPATTSTTELVDMLHGLGRDEAVDGILLQHPVPDTIDERAAFEAIEPGKDVDGVTMHSFSAMAFGLDGFQSCTPSGILRLLDSARIDIAGRHAVVVGRSPILGKPVGMLLLGRDATVTLCHSHTDGLPEVVRTGDLVVAAVGRPDYIRGDWIKPGAVVVDAGYNPGNIGDVALSEAVGVASAITPVPGGVGPVTIAVLLEQTVHAAESLAEARAE